jgi:hypothetical protein
MQPAKRDRLAELEEENARLRQQIADQDSEISRLWAVLSDEKRLKRRLLALWAGRRGPLIGIVAGMVAAYVFAVATPFDEKVAAWIHRALAHDQIHALNPPADAHPLRFKEVPAPDPSPVQVNSVDNGNQGSAPAAQGYSLPAVPDLPTGKGHKRRVTGEPPELELDVGAEDSKLVSRHPPGVTLEVAAGPLFG